MSRRMQIYILVGLIVLLVVEYVSNRTQVAGLSGVLADDGKFTPLSVQEPQLRLDLLENLKRLQYDDSGTHRNIFTAQPPPIVVTPAERAKIAEAAANPPPPVIQPVQVPGEFFGFAWMPKSKKRVAFFKNGEDVFLVAEGDTFFERYRLVHIGNDSADVLEISSGRHATITMTQPPNAGS